MMLLYFCSSFLQQDDPIDLITRNDMPPLVIVSSSSNTESESPLSLKKELLNMRDSEEVVTKLHQYPSNQNVDSVPNRELASCTTTSITTTLAGGQGCTAQYGSCGNFFKIDAIQWISITQFTIKPRLTGSQTIQIWARSGDYAGFTGSTSGWSQIYSASITIRTSSLNLPLSTALVVGAGTSHSFHIRSTLGLKFTGGGSTTTPYRENCALKIYGGKSGRFGTYRYVVFMIILLYDI